MNITNVKVDANGRTSVHWDIGEFYFHYWQQDRDQNPGTFTIYKNRDNEGISYHDSRYFHTKHLKAAAAINRQMIQQVDAIVKAGDLFAKASAEYAAKEAAKEAEDAERGRVFDLARGTIRRMQETVASGAEAYQCVTIGEVKALLMFMEGHGVQISN
jgi:hypothetical protein